MKLGRPVKDVELGKLYFISRISYRDGRTRYKYAYFYEDKKYAEITVWKLINFTHIFN